MIKSPSQMSALGAVRRFEGPPVDAQHRLLEPRPPPIYLLMRTPVIAPGPQGRATLWRQREGRKSSDPGW